MRYLLLIPKDEGLENSDKGKKFESPLTFKGMTPRSERENYKQMHWVNSQYLIEENYEKDNNICKLSNSTQCQSPNQLPNITNFDELDSKKNKRNSNEIEELKEKNNNLLKENKELKDLNEYVNANFIPKKKYDILMNLYNEQKEKNDKHDKPTNKHITPISINKLEENNKSQNIIDIKRPGLFSISSDRDTKNPQTYLISLTVVRLLIFEGF